MGRSVENNLVKMNSQIQKVLKQALITFKSKPEVFAANLQLLSAILDKLTAEDVKLDIRKLENKENPSEQGAAPVTYIDIYEDSIVTMGIFVLKQNKKLPLHNHPEMHGLLKVLSGKVRIISYSINTSKTLEVDSQTRITDNNAQLQNALKLAPRPRRLVTAELTSDDIVDSTCKSCLLQPNDRNIHEIHSVDGPAAFLDILAPPYMTEIPNSGLRYCSYYSVLSNVATNVFRLQEIRNPPWYWTDTTPYAGPDPTVDLEMESN